MDLSKLCQKVLEIAKIAGDYAKQQQKTKRSSLNIQEKKLHDFVTEVDKTSEQMIVERLQKLIPNAGFIAEENDNAKKTTEWLWFIDPLDGTTNFIHNLPLFSISIALMHNDELVLGVIYEPNFNEMFYAWKNGGAWMNNQQINVSKTTSLNNSLLATGFPFHDYSLLEQYISFLKYTIKHTRGLRRLGSAALDLAWVACGRFDGFYEYGLKPWDVAAGVCIVSEAGGHTTDFNNGRNFIFGQEIISTNGLIHQELVAAIRKFFK